MCLNHQINIWKCHRTYIAWCQPVTVLPVRLHLQAALERVQTRGRENVAALVACSLLWPGAIEQTVQKEICFNPVRRTYLCHASLLFTTGHLARGLAEPVCGWFCRKSVSCLVKGAMQARSQKHSYT